MNRDIKFRVWDKELKHFINYATIPLGLKGDSYHFYSNYQNDGRFILLQFTGLKDKNGKEIYEADIIKYPQDSAYPNKFDYMVIEWENDYDGFGGLNCGFRMGGDYATQKNTEIVGNIFENPELIH